MRCLIIILSNVFVVFCLVCFAEGTRRGSNIHPYLFNFMRDMDYEKESYENNGIDKMATSLLHDIYVRSGPRYNIVLSPISIWFVLVMLWEGAAGFTENQLKMKLGITYRNRDEGGDIIHNQLRRLKNIFQAKNTSTEFTSLNFFISDKMKYISPKYKNLIRTVYDGEVFEVETTKDKDKYARLINTSAFVATGNRIRSVITPEALNDLVMIIGNAVFLKSKWKHPFRPELTTSMPFVDEKDYVLGRIPMMLQMLSFPYKYSEELESKILEIPYADDLTSMIVILPDRGVSLEKVLMKMRNKSLKEIVRDNMTMEPINLFLPRFSAVSDLNLNEVLRHELSSLFNPREASFPFLGNDVFVSRIMHTGKIENTEVGTTSTAITSVDFVYKTSITEFRANRPFIYFINEIKTRMPLMVGTFSNPASSF